MLRNEMQTKAGVEKLVQFYVSDPVAQKKAENELVEADKKLKALQDGKKVVKGQLSELKESSAGDANTNANVSATANANVTVTTTQSQSQPPQQSQSRPSAEAGGTALKVKGLFDYEATCETELSFKEGDILSISEQDESGWWYAELSGKFGFVPQNYVEVVDSK